MESDFWGPVSSKVVTKGMKRKCLTPKGPSGGHQAVPGFPNIPHSHVHDR